ncbi:hypothetical protein, partial [Desulfovibrio legallii]|uniref:hypothetical protein n=1 Tax=Desulfovibrio legallii TaxID=571438 RepID=UPI003A8FD1B8
CAQKFSAFLSASKKSYFFQPLRHQPRLASSAVQGGFAQWIRDDDVLLERKAHENIWWEGLGG